MAKKSKGNRPTRSPAAPESEADEGPGFVRIIAGQWRRRLLPYSGDRRTRPMKDRVRENVFNLLQQVVDGTHAVDLFAGTGALGFEALSRGAARATFCEQHIPAARQIWENVELLGATDRACVLTGDAFRHFANFAEAEHPWMVFCSPPYEMYVSRLEELQALVRGLYDRAPSGSWFVVECDAHFDPNAWDWTEWDVRRYPPAVIGIAEK